MSNFYGGFSKDKDKKANYIKRISSLTNLAEQCVKKTIDNYPKLDGLIFISYQNIHISVGRYFNDVDHYKKRHNIKLTHTSKIIAHTIKWVAIYPVIFCSALDIHWESLNKEEKKILININYMFIQQIIQHFIDPINPNISESTYEEINTNLMYFLKTGNYNERMASLWFEQIIKG